MGKEGSKDRLEMVSTWAKKVPRMTRDGFKKANLGKEGPKDGLGIVSREPAWAKKVARID